MKKHIILSLLAITMLTACNSKTENVLDLSGTWSSDKSAGNYQEAIISGDEIEIDWKTSDTSSLYWAGSYDAPVKKVKEYSWISKNNKEKTGAALLASQDDTKKISYKDGVISYDVSVMGITQTMKLTKTGPVPETTAFETESSSESPTAIAETIPEETTHSSKELPDRGLNRNGREEPIYKGTSGYVALYPETSFDYTESCFETPWLIPIYEKVEQSWNEIGTIEHKTAVTVLDQELKHEGWGTYSGYLLVANSNTDEQFYINVKNFVTKPYWSFDDLEDAASVGYYIAEFNQTSDFCPESRGDKVDIENGTKVLVTSRSRGYNTGDTVEGTVFKEWSQGYGGVTIDFNPDDLTIIY